MARAVRKIAGRDRRRAMVDRHALSARRSRAALARTLVRGRLRRATRRPAAGSGAAGALPRHRMGSSAHRPAAAVAHHSHRAEPREVEAQRGGSEGRAAARGQRRGTRAESVRQSADRSRASARHRQRKHRRQTATRERLPQRLHRRRSPRCSTKPARRSSSPRIKAAA